ncbi:class I SAM-dependent RNA methyltransferase [Lactobacillus sp. YT155]|uniref:THUMP domain-containing class I SAM-dependent RNA methyltransferase n=1 Tax=Lactobacillus sp. YT155 TaxID=3060955 RepID=UPI00265F8CFF|nr:class I SAM-dependent RNA methyltransferase [Lactobacillus sp. YT155]MDO1605430.1 class I SAM-dependent RNA methyltransferase [Lactobacillus sp. YT155]
MIYNLLATMASGFESLTAKELQNLGYETQTENGRVLFSGTQEDIVNSNLWLRTADRIKIIVADFKATSFEELFDKINEIAWDEYLPMNASFPVNARSVKSKLFSTRDIQAISKKSIVNKLSDIYHRRGILPESGSTYAIEVRIVKDNVEITLDTTGESLFKRGYRIEHGGAPLKENFAAALVMLTNWHADMPFYDPTTGSGTIPIEAALIAKNIAPGLNRKFAFEEFDWFDDSLLSSAKETAKKQIKDINLNIFASDIDQNMIDVAKLNANNAGVLHDITFKQIALKDLKIEESNGVLISNPPYGVRMKDTEEVHQLYKQMGDVFEKLDHWSKYYLTSDLDFQGFYGKQATKRRKLYNGAIRTDYFQYWA